MNSTIEINGIHLIADAMAVADANVDAQCEWALALRPRDLRTSFHLRDKN